jgi:hypothetical protein
MNNLINEIHEIKIYGRTLSYYRKNGINCNYGDVIKVKSSELCPTSRIIVKCLCEECENEFTIAYFQYKKMKNVVCSAKCRAKQTKIFLNKTYGIDNVSQLEISKLKKINKAQEKYGVDNVSQSSLIKEEKVKTAQLMYGVDNISQSEIIKKRKILTCRKNYNVDYPSQSKIVFAKYVKTIQEKYGIEFTNISQVSGIMDKKISSGISTRKYILPSGRILKIQGYENFGIEYLINSGIVEDDIVTGNKEIENEIGTFWFNKNGKKCRYFPDIYVKSQRKVYEVKSAFTINLNIDLIELKRQSIISNGFTFAFLIFDKNGNKL